MDCIRLLGKGLDTGWIPFCCSLGASSIGTMSRVVFISLCNTCTVSSRGRGGSYFRFFPQNLFFLNANIAGLLFLLYILSCRSSFDIMQGLGELQYWCWLRPHHRKRILVVVLLARHCLLYMTVPPTLVLRDYLSRYVRD